MIADPLEKEPVMRGEFNILIEEGEDGYLISQVVELPGCHTQARSLDELIARTRKAIQLYLKCDPKGRGRGKFLGLQKIAV